MNLSRTLNPRTVGAAKAVTAAAAVILLAAGCTDNNAAKGGSPGLIQVRSSADACMLSAAEAPSGILTFNIMNEGDQVTEFYLLGADGQQIIGEMENIGPGISRQLVVSAAAGGYIANCKPGMTGEGIRHDFTVSPTQATENVDADQQVLIDAASARYAGFVKAEADALLAGTRDFAGAFAAGDAGTARGLYAAVRMHWERIEPVAESFGDLDPKLDLREADLEPGSEWTGWHRAEKDLWAPAGYTAMTAAERQMTADLLVSDTEELIRRTAELSFTPDQLGNGAIELLSEVATGKVTGEEEAWSHTDLWDFQANVDGAKEAFTALQPLLAGKDTELAGELSTRFADIQAALDKHKVGEGFVYYDQLTQEQIQELAAQVDALSEPLSRLTAAVVR